MSDTLARLLRPLLSVRTAVLLATGLLLSALPLHAQDSPIDPGVYILDGSVSFRSQGGDLYSADGDRQTTISLQPAGLYVLAPKTAVGGQLRVSRSSQDTGSTTTLGLGPSVTYYLGEPDAEVFPFVAANLLLLRSSRSVDLGSVDIGFGDPVELGEEDITLTGLAVDIQAGFTYMLARNVGLTTAAFFLYERLGSDDTDAQAGNTLGVQVGITAFIF
jgi:hypothetical protein